MKIVSTQNDWSMTGIEWLVLIVSGRREMHPYPDWRQLWHSGGDGVGIVKGEGGISPLDNNTVTNVTVQLGATAYLHCHVRTIGTDRTMQGGPEVNFHQFPRGGRGEKSQ